MSTGRITLFIYLNAAGIMDLIKYMIGLHDFVWFLISLFFLKVGYTKKLFMLILDIQQK